MSNREKIELQKRYEELPDEVILDMLSEEEGSYTEDARELLLKEARKRGLQRGKKSGSAQKIQAGVSKGSVNEKVSAMKKCPFCAEEIQEETIKCKHCGESLKEGNKRASSTNKSFNDNFIGKEIKRTNRNLLLVNISVIAGIIFLWWNNAFSEVGYWGLGIFGLIIFSGWNIIKVFRRKKKPSLHPINIALSRFGPPEKVANIINEEARVPKTEVKPIIVTNSWLLQPSFYGLEIILLGELAWIYNRVTTNYTNGVRTGESYSVAICKRDGKLLEVSCSQLASSILLARVTEGAPWVVQGYSKELQALWDTDRASFIAHIDQKKREINTGVK